MKTIQLRIFFLVRSYWVREGENTDQKKLRIRSLFRQCKNAQEIDEETRSEFQKVAAVCTFTALVKIEFFIGVFWKFCKDFWIILNGLFEKLSFSIVIRTVSYDYGFSQLFWSEIFRKRNYFERANICSRSLVETTGQRSGIFTMSYRINSLSLLPCA